MKLRRAFTLVELLVVFAILAILATIVMTTVFNRSSTSTSINVAPSPTAPERATGYHVHQIPVDSGLELLSTKIHKLLVKWLQEHPEHKLVEVINTEDGYIVLVTETR